MKNEASVPREEMRKAGRKINDDYTELQTVMRITMKKMTMMMMLLFRHTYPREKHVVPKMI